MASETIVPRVLWGVALLALAGCAKTGAVPCHPVSGQVMYAGKPAEGVRVYLMPTSAPVVPQIPANPHAVTGPDGRFEIGTYAQNDGAPEGGYQVVMYWTKPDPDNSEDADVDLLLGWYDPARSKLTAQIKAGSNELPVIQVPTLREPPARSEGVPGRN